MARPVYRAIAGSVETILHEQQFAFCVYVHEYDNILQTVSRWMCVRLHNRGMRIKTQETWTNMQVHHTSVGKRQIESETLVLFFFWI